MTLPSLRRRPDARLVIPLVIALLWPGAVTAQQPVLPQGAQVVGGSATVTSPSPAAMVITQDGQRAIINWQDFSIGAGGVVDIHQPGAAAALLNRVTGGNLSTILGQLRANGQVYLLNPQGIVVGPGGTIDTAAFVGSTLNTSNEIFMRGGPLTFSGDSQAGIVNIGTITSALGDVILIAPRIANTGTIAAPQGTAALLAGTQVLYAPGGGSLLIQAPAGTGTIDNSGGIRAAEVALQAAGSPYALAVNNAGAISATSLSRTGGRILLSAGAGDVSNSGSLTATGEVGGAIDVAGANVALTGAAVLDVSGRTGGGAIRVGGGFRGQDPEIVNAATTTVGDGVVLRADAGEHGNAGTVAVWADQATTFEGRIEARGGANGGNGGEAEVSGYHDLVYRGRSDLSAASGATGTLLLDPGTVTIDAAMATTIQNDLNTANVVIDTNDVYDLITVTSPVTNPTTTNKLTLDADTITVDASISLPLGTIQFGPPNGGQRTSLTSAPGATVTADLISVTGSFTSVDFAGPLMAPDNGLLLLRQLGTPGSFTATHGANQIKNLYLNSVTVPLSGDLDIRSSVATTLSGMLESSANVTIISAGDLSSDDGCGGTTLTVAGTTTLGSTGGVINTNNALTLAGAGRKRLYSATTNAPFNVSGLAGYTQHAGVSFASDPEPGNVIYIAAGTVLPSLTVTADNQAMVYGAFEPAYTASFNGGSASDLTSPVQFRLDRAPRDVGAYAIIPFGAASSSHTLSYVNGTLTVTPAPLLISGPTVSSPYGSALPVFTPQFSGFRLGDGPAVVSGLTWSTDATSRSPVGGYDLRPSGASARNYTISYASGRLTITPAVLRVTANNATRLYGGTNPTFGASFSGLVNGDLPAVVSGLQFSTTAATASPVGAYPITITGGTAANYQLQYVPGTLTVNPAPLSASTSVATITYGQTAPPLTMSVNGLVAGDTIGSLGIGYAINVPPGTSVGVYPTTLTGSLSNYFVSYTPGAIFIQPKGLVITAHNLKRYQFTANPVFTGAIDGLFGGDHVTVTYSTTATAESAAGRYTITPTAADTPNYTYTYVLGTLTVEQPPPPPPPDGALVTTTDGSPSLTGGKVTLKPLGDLSNTPPPANDVSISVAGPSLAAMLHNSTSVVNKALAEYSKTTGDQSISQLQYLMNTNSLGPNQEVGKLLPFLIGQAKEIIDRDESTWTSEERAFITYMTNTMAAQKKAAAEEANRQLDAWKKEQAVELSKNLGAAFSTVGIPPAHFLNQAQSGVALNQNNTAVVVGLAATAATVAAAATASVASGAAVAAVKVIAPFVGSMAAATAKAAVAGASAAGAGTAAAKAAADAALAGVAGTTAAGAAAAVAVVVVAAVTAIVVKAVQVGQAREYDAKMQEALVNSQKPMTNADLKALLSNDTGVQAAFMYLATSAANNAGK